MAIDKTHLYYTFNYTLSKYTRWEMDLKRQPEDIQPGYGMPSDRMESLGRTCTTARDRAGSVDFIRQMTESETVENEGRRRFFSRYEMYSGSE